MNVSRRAAEQAETGNRISAGSRRRWLARIVLVSWCIIVPLAAGEAALRMASRSGILLFDVEMWRYATEIKRPSERPGVVLEHKRNTEATLMGVRIRTDGHGFRRAAPDLEASRTGTERLVAVIGDSCALGWGVPEGATMAEQLEGLLNGSGRAADHRVTVINDSVGNSNTAMEYARYIEDVRPLHPAWVILAFFVNDAEPDPRPANPLLLEHSVLLATLAMRAPTLLFPAYRDYHGYYESLYRPQSVALENFRRALRALGTALEQDGIPGSMILVPEMHQPREFGPFADVYRQVAALGEESGFEVIDPSHEFAPGSGQAYWVTAGDPHPNAKAHAVFAAALARSPTARRLMQPVS